MKLALATLVSLAGCDVPEVTYIVTDAAFPSVALREGQDGYTGTVDTYIESMTPTATHGTEQELRWGMTNNTHMLIRFDNIFPDRIPMGATIRDAILELTISTQGSTAGMLYESVQSWDESTTYNTFGPNAGVGVEDRGTQQIGLVDGSPSGTTSIHVGVSLQKWAQDPTMNRGWILLPNDAAAVAVRSSETNNIDLRPTLIIVYAEP